MTAADITIVMPVFNTGEYLEQAISSVLAQHANANERMPTYELVVVDDHSTDPMTLDILARHTSSPNVRLLKNQRRKGVSGARNTAIEAADSKWIGFLDSDDFYLPGALSSRWSFIEQHPNVKWVAANHLLHTLERGLQNDPLSVRSPTLYGIVKSDHDHGLPSRVERPVALFAKYCAVSPNTVLILRDLIVKKGLFDEDLARAEDYQLWLKCAVDHDLWYVPKDTAAYRIRPGSLTRGREPMYFHEHRMIESLLERSEFGPHSALLTRRMDFVLASYCGFYRREGRNGEALRWAARWLTRSPGNVHAWKQLIAAILHR